MARLVLNYKSDGVLQVTALDGDGAAITSASGTVVITNATGTTVSSGALVESGGGAYIYAIADDISVADGDKLTAKVTVTKSGVQGYSEFPIRVRTDTA